MIHDIIHVEHDAGCYIKTRVIGWEGVNSTVVQLSWPIGDAGAMHVRE